MHGVSIFDDKARFIWISHLPPELKGRGSFIGKPAWDLSPHNERAIVREAFCRAAFDGEPTELQVTNLAGGRYMLAIEPLEIGGFVARWHDLPQRSVKLTAREREILIALAKDETREATAHRLGIATRTVETFRRNARQKIGAKGLAGMIRWAIRMGLIES